MEKESAQRIRRRDGPWGWYGCFHRITRYSLLAEYAASRAAIITGTQHPVGFRAGCRKTAALSGLYTKPPDCCQLQYDGTGR